MLRAQKQSDYNAHSLTDVVSYPDRFRRLHFIYRVLRNGVKWPADRWGLVYEITDADPAYTLVIVRCPPTWRLATVAKEVGQLIGFVQRVYTIYSSIACEVIAAHQNRSHEDAE